VKKAFLLRDIDPDLWREYKAACAHDGRAARGDLIEHIIAKVQDYHIYQSGFFDPRLIRKDKRDGKVYVGHEKRWKEAKKNVD